MTLFRKNSRRYFWSSVSFIFYFFYISVYYTQNSDVRAVPLLLCAGDTRDETYLSPLPSIFMLRALSLECFVYFPRARPLRSTWNLSPVVLEWSKSGVADLNQNDGTQALISTLNCKIKLYNFNSKSHSSAFPSSLKQIRLTGTFLTFPHKFHRQIVPKIVQIIYDIFSRCFTSISIIASPWNPGGRETLTIPPVMAYNMFEIPRRGVAFWI